MDPSLNRRNPGLLLAAIWLCVGVVCGRNCGAVSGMADHARGRRYRKDVQARMAGAGTSAKAGSSRD